MTEVFLVDWLAPFAAWAGERPALVAALAFGMPIAVAILWRLLARTPPPAPVEHAPARPRPVVPEAVAAEAAAPRPAPARVEPAPPHVEAPPAPPRAAPAPEPAIPPELRPRPLRERLARTSEALVGRLGVLLGGRTLDDAAFEELEALLFTADLGVKTAEGLLARVRAEARGADAARVRELLRTAITEKLRRVEPSEAGLALRGRPHVILVLGVNGSGKTTTIGKLAARHRAEGHRAVLGAGDTFRHAAVEQLQAWGERAGCEVVAGTQGGDPASVAYDTIKAAVARHADVAIIDTAGRLQTKVPLMQELQKIVRVIGRELEGAPHEVLLVLDANTGQNAISQAREFTSAAGVTGLVLTKLDGTAKGGVLIGLADEFRIPVRYIGVGESVEDLRDFSADAFVEALFG
jgi:fused signal recognition particle receptor